MRFSVVCALCTVASLATLAAPASGSLENQAAGALSSTNVVDRVVRFAAKDGTPLEGKLSLPTGAKGPLPVVFYLHGAGPRTFDNVIQYRDQGGRRRVYNYFDCFSHALASRGVAFFRVSKRGCTTNSSGQAAIDRNVFSRATPSVLLDDYVQALEALRQRTEIDADRVVLLGSSEGTRLAPTLATRSSEGIVGLVLMSFQSVNQKETLVWQHTVGPWRNVQKIIAVAGGGQLTRAEYDVAVKNNGLLARILPFATFDTDMDGTVTSEELSRTTRGRLDAIFKAVDERNDEFIWENLFNLSSAYLLDDWNGEPTHVTLLKLDVPIAICHGELDGTTSLEGVRKAQTVFRVAGRTNLVVLTYPDHDHDLNWTIESARRGEPAPFQDAFDFVAKLLRRADLPPASFQRAAIDFREGENYLGGC